MSESETGVMASLQNAATVTEPVIHNMRLAYSSDGTAVYKPVAGISPPFQSAVAGGDGSVLAPNLNVSMGDPVKKKRGRPRKYGPGGAITLALTPPPGTAPQSTGTFSPSPPPFTVSSGGGGSASHSYLKKAKGRPPGSSKKQQLEALGSAGVGFTPHVITVKAGEDVSSKIMAFSQQGPRTVCILSAIGSISNVTLRQAASSGGTATYEGRFDILSLSGSFQLMEVGGHRSRTGGLSVTLAGPDGRVLGGCVAGLLTAASPVQVGVFGYASIKAVPTKGTQLQVIVGSFISDGRKDSKPVIQMEDPSAPLKLIVDGGVTSASSPPSRGTLSESSGGPGSPLNHSVGAYNNTNPQGISSMPWM